MKSLIVAGIGTDVGKTLVSAVLCQALGADYWKPVQSGIDDGPSDAETIRGLVTNGAVHVHPSVYSLRKSLSPHAAAAIDGVTIELDKLAPPETKRPLVIELAGGVMVPLTGTHTSLDLISALGCSVVIVSRHYLGSINHTLLTVLALQSREVPIAGLIFTGGHELPQTESVIEGLTKLPVLARIPHLDEVTPASVERVARGVRIDL
jgi:dethiobiotin synthetase